MRLEFPAKPILIPRNRKIVAWPVVELVFPPLFGLPLRQKVLIDTGATNTIFPFSLAPYLGIANVQELPAIQLGAGTGVIKAHVTRTRMVIHVPGSADAGWEWTGEIVLANVRTSHYGVLGHIGFLEYFDFELRSEEEFFTLEDNSRFPGVILQ